MTQGQRPGAASVAGVATRAAVLRRIELDVLRRLDGSAAGDHLTTGIGPGSERAGARAYEPGDDARLIDWNLTARSAETFVRQTEADRESETWIVADRSASLTTLMEYARRRSVPLTVENLRGGPSSDPDSFAALLRQTGAPVTFDLGHAAGCPWVLEGQGTVVDFIRAIPTPILSGHVYFIERNDTHFAPATLADLAPALDALAERGCDFWVLELHTLETLQQTRLIVDQYLRERKESARA